MAGLAEPRASGALPPSKPRDPFRQSRSRVDAKQFADEIVEPTITEFEREPSSRRRAFLACVATFHLIDYLALPAKPATLRQKVSTRVPSVRGRRPLRPWV